MTFCSPFVGDQRRCEARLGVWLVLNLCTSLVWGTSAGRKAGGEAASGLVPTVGRVGACGCGSWDGRQVVSIACRRVVLEERVGGIGEDCASRAGFGIDSLDGGLEGGGSL